MTTRSSASCRASSAASSSTSARSSRRTPKGYLAARFAVDEARLLALDPNVDLNAVRTALAAIAAVCAGGAPAGAIGRLSLRERFHWLVAPRSTMIQTSAVHTGRCDDLADALDHLLERMVRPPTTSGPSP